MKILFLDQSGKIGGGQLSLADVATPYRHSCLVGLFGDGPYRQLLEHQQIPVQVLADRPLLISKDSTWLRGIGSMPQLIPLITAVAQLSRHYDLIYTNTQKALVVGAIASYLTDRPLVHHLHDILSVEHFSRPNLYLAVVLINRFAQRVIANSQATKAAFIQAGGRADLVEVVHNGFQAENYQVSQAQVAHMRQELEITDQFVVGHFSRLSPWKGQHILLEALTHCSKNIIALFIGDALFGEDWYVQKLHQRTIDLGLQERVRFLGFRSDIASLMAACNLVTHTSIAPEPFGRVVVEAMLVGCPVVTVSTGGTLELVEHGRTGWLLPPSDPVRLAEIIRHCYDHPQQVKSMAQQALLKARQRFNLAETNRQIQALLDQVQARQARLAICRELSKTKP